MKVYLNKAFSDCFLPCLFTSLSFFLIGPISLYISNADEFSFYISDILPLLALSTVICFTVLFGICSLIKKRKPRSVFSAIILGVGLGFFIQSSFMSGGYGQLNGEEINWDGMIGRGLINTAVWVACVAIPVVLSLLAGKGKRFQAQKIIGGMVLGIQVISLAVMLFSSGILSGDQNEEFTISTSDAFTLSDDKNVVVFLLDNFSSVLYEEIVNEDPSYQEKFNGFTYFPDTSGVGCTTKGSLPFILTGLWNENTMKYKDYLNAGYDNALYNALQDLDYDTRLFVDKKYVGTQSVDFFDNMYREKATVSVGKTTGLMYKFTAFTYMPHFLKPLFWFYTGEFASTTQASDSTLKLNPDPTFYKSLVNNGITVNKDYKGAYRFYYLSGAHSPYNMNENAEAVPSGSVTMKQRGQGALKIVSTYLDELRMNGLYDNTMVVVLADHGDWEDEVVFNPMLFVKPFASKTEGLGVSKAQITYADLMPTLVEAVTGKDSGMTLFEVSEGMERERRFMYYNWDGDWSAEYLPDLYEYIISGNIRDMISRRPTGKVYTGSGVINNSVEYNLGDKVTYTTATEGEQTYVYYGMYYPEEGHTFTKGNYTQWVFPLSEYNGSDLIYTLQVIGVRGDSQRVRLTVNGEYLEEVTVTTGGNLSFEIPARLIDEDKEVAIRLDYPDASASQSDVRVRSLAIRSVVLDYIVRSEYTLGTEISYGSSAEGENFCYSGLHKAEEKYSFSTGCTKWLFPLASYEGGDLQFTLRISGVRGNNQRVSIIVNGEPLKEIVVKEGGTLNIRISEDCITNNQVKIQLDFPDASASEKDARIRALAIKAVVLDYAK